MRYKERGRKKKRVLVGGTRTMRYIFRFHEGLDRVQTRGALFEYGPPVALPALWSHALLIYPHN